MTLFALSLSVFFSDSGLVFQAKAFHPTVGLRLANCCPPRGMAPDPLTFFALDNAILKRIVGTA